MSCRRLLAASFTLLTLVTTVSATAFAQQEPPVVAGDRVRFKAPAVATERLVGTLASLAADTCVMYVEGRADPLTLPLASLTWLQVSRGRESRVGRGAVIGTLVGVAVGLLAPLYVCGWEEIQCPGEGSIGFLVLWVGSVAGGALLGAGTGALIGSTTIVDHWETIPLNEIRVGPSRVTVDGVAMSLSIPL